MKIIANILLGLMTLSLCSCTTTGGIKRSEIENLKTDVYQLSSRVNSLEESNQQLHAQMESVRSANTANQLAMQDTVSGMRKELNSSSASRDAMKNTIITEISAGMSKIIGEQSGSSQGEVGRYHTVAKGDTLSAIATAYNSSMNVIVKANRLKNADAIRIGQRLFIPE